MAASALDPRTRLVLRPFRGMRFNPDLIGDVAAVTCPPYDVMDRTMIEQLLDTHPYNVVRLILPRLVNDPSDADDPYRAAAKRLNRWRRQGVLVTDRDPGLYVYEYGDRTAPVRGLVGTLDLRRRHRGAVYPHEDVIPAVVADRLAMVEASDVELEPILLVYEGDAAASDAMDEATQAKPLLDMTADDRTVHRLWAVSEPQQIERIEVGLAAHRALIADGHHRFAMYRQLRRSRRVIGRGAAPWDFGLSLLIDQARYPITVGPIHRSIAELTLDALASMAPGRVVADVEMDPAHVEPPTSAGLVVLTDGYRAVTLSLDAARRPGTDDGPTTDVGLLHDVLLPRWEIGEDRLGYHHSVEQAVHHAMQEGGIAVLLHATTFGDVMAVAAAGGMLPRKSTSFRPKPRAGIVMRAFADQGPIRG